MPVRGGVDSDGLQRYGEEDRGEHGTTSMSKSCPLQPQFQKSRSLDRIEAIWHDVAEAQRFVQRHRRAHRWQRVEAHPRVAAASRLVDDGHRERAAEVSSTK